MTRSTVEPGRPPRCEAVDKRGQGCPATGRHYRDGHRVCGTHANCTEVAGWKTPAARELATIQAGGTLPSYKPAPRVTPQVPALAGMAPLGMPAATPNPAPRCTACGDTGTPIGTAPGAAYCMCAAGHAAVPRLGAPRGYARPLPPPVAETPELIDGQRRPLPGQLRIDGTTVGLELPTVGLEPERADAPSLDPTPAELWGRAQLDLFRLDLSQTRRTK